MKEIIRWIKKQTTIIKSTWIFSKSPVWLFKTREDKKKRNPDLNEKYANPDTQNSTVFRKQKKVAEKKVIKLFDNNKE